LGKTRLKILASNEHLSYFGQDSAIALNMLDYFEPSLRLKVNLNFKILDQNKNNKKQLNTLVYLDTLGKSECLA
jgi:hypothetical protein